jgi:hypothetical protein
MMECWSAGLLDAWMFSGVWSLDAWCFPDAWMFAVRDWAYSAFRPGTIISPSGHKLLESLPLALFAGAHYQIHNAA